MTQEEIKKKYDARYITHSAERDLVIKKIRKYGLFRIVFFLSWLIIIYVATNWTWPFLAGIITFGIIIFGFLVNRHGAFHRRKAALDQLVRINREENDAMNWNFNALDDGKDYIATDHLFSFDLDIFGNGGLFQYINRTSTLSGRDKLAMMFSHIEKDKADIENRQKVIAELAPMLDWRQDFRVVGLMTEEKRDDIDGLKTWVNTPPHFNALVFRILVMIVPLINLAVFMLVVAGLISFWHFLAYLVVPLLLAGIKHRKVNLKHNMLGRKYPVLRKYAGLFMMIEEREFSSAKMQENKRILHSNGTSASRAIHKLAKVSNAFDTRLNLLAGFLMNIFFLWDIRQSLRLEKWQKKYKAHLPEWFEVMAKVDAFVSLAGYCYNNPGYVFPVISQAEELCFDAKEIGHPLIHANKRICNDFAVCGWSNFTILTGANMAGKSTFLRTVGVNMILACCGAPVCANVFIITPVDLVTSIHTIDSLANNESYFYAELKRLQRIIFMLKEDRKVFIILDEILKGTNSDDKQSGSKALVKQLINLKAAGIIATHDLSLGLLEKRFPANVKNKCFEVNIEKDRLDYDYRIKDGIAQNMNATILMERMGITVQNQV